MAGKSAPKKSLSNLKRERQAETHRLRNQSIRTKLRTLTKQLDVAMSGNKGESIEQPMKKAIKAISAAASKGIIHKNTAARKISRLAKKANKTLAG
ncbi:MAG: 30S ribosomal protein S20 [Nitrospirae bacterium]|nr:30S ribosomal protein S20 [Nitrospirota bacterium]